MEIATFDFYLEVAQNIDGQLELQREPLSEGVVVQRGLARSQASRSPGDGKQVWKWTCSPSVPHSTLPTCNEEQWLCS